MPRVHVKTFGCQMNEYDSARMADVLRESCGYEPTDDPAAADLLLLNTCSVREKAQEKVFSLLGRWRELKFERPHVMIGVGGCVASQEGEGITARAPFVDLVFGPQTLHRLPEMIARLQQSGRAVVDVSFPEIEKFDRLPEPRAAGATAFVSIMEGCSKYCTFCVVPYTRGEEMSRPLAQVLDEVRSLADKGVREVTLLGQNVNAYRGSLAGGGHADLAALIYFVAEVPGIERIRFTTSHPVEFRDSLIEAYRDVPKLMSYLHLPVQSGSDRVLALMKRGHTALEYKQKIRRLREVRPALNLSSDFIVGFPGETERDFEATLALIAEVGFDQSFSFIYSRRPGTPAASLPDGLAARGKAAATRAPAGTGERAGHGHQPRHGRHRAARARRAARPQGHPPARRTHREQPLGQLRRPGLAHRRFRGRRHNRGDAELAARPARRARAEHRLNEQVETRDVSLEGADNARLGNFAGPMEQNLRHVEERLGVEVRRRGHQLQVLGAAGTVDNAAAVLRRMFELSASEAMSPERVHLCVQEHGFPRADEVPRGEREIVVHTQRGGIRGRGANQRQYLDSIRANDLTFGIGPAGTGKTYLAVASAVESLQAGAVRRIVLVRPAVEAGERLGFLPGDLAQKVDPYLRPMYDALYEMLGFDRVARNIERQVIEVAPLAFMRGRIAQRLVHHPRRGTEHHRRADEDVPDAPRLRLEGGRHGRHHPDRPAAPAALRPAPCHRGAARRGGRGVHVLQRVRRRASSAGAAHRAGLRARVGRPGAGGVSDGPAPVLRVEAQVAVRRPWVPTTATLRRWAGAAHAALGSRARRAVAPPPASVCIRVVGSAESRRLNREYRGKDRPTNVLSFPASSVERELGGSLGDLVVCAAVVSAEAREQGKERAAHWAHMVVHGMLHLHGLDHATRREAAAMERREVEILRGFGYQNPYLPVTPPKP